ncbi:MAG: PAS domain S-box protein [Desulfobacterales bacterium]|nr:PAS domain S-box protein [Desulfobacterales bacterium]
MKNRIAHLNLVLRAIRRVDELITREKDPDRLLQGVCDNLIENRGYHNAWIALLDPAGGFLKAVQAGLGADFAGLVAQLRSGKLTRCGQFALARAGVIVTENPLCDCPDCPLARNYSGRGAMTVRLAHAGRIYGFLSVSIPRELAQDPEEQALFSEVAEDIGFALHGIEVEAARQEAVAALQESEEKFRKISSSAQDAIIMMDHEGRISFWNQAAEKVLGYSQEEALGRELHLWLAPGALPRALSRRFQNLPNQRRRPRHRPDPGALGTSQRRRGIPHRTVGFGRQTQGPLERHRHSAGHQRTQAGGTQIDRSQGSGRGRHPGQKRISGQYEP